MAAKGKKQRAAWSLVAEEQSDGHRTFVSPHSHSFPVTTALIWLQRRQPFGIHLLFGWRDRWASSSCSDLHEKNRTVWNWYQRLRIATENPLMLRSSGRQYTSSSFIDSYTFSHCHIVLENAPWLCRSSEWPPWKWEVNRSKLQRRNRWGTAWSDVANTSLCRFAPPGHECYVPLHRAWMWRWCQWVHVPFRYTSTQKLDENISRNTTWNAQVKLPFLSKHRVCRYTYTYTLKFQSLQYKNIHTRWNIDNIAVIHLRIHKTFLLNMGNLIISDITTSTFSRVICLQDFFEAVLGQQSCYWTAISRSHLVLTEVDPGSFLVQRLDQKKWQMSES